MVDTLLYYLVCSMIAANFAASQQRLFFTSKSKRSFFIGFEFESPLNESKQTDDDVCTVG
jgi:hypothetical protein